MTERVDDAVAAGNGSPGLLAGYGLDTAREADGLPPIAFPGGTGITTSIENGGRGQQGSIPGVIPAFGQSTAGQEPFPF